MSLGNSRANLTDRPTVVSSPATFGTFFYSGTDAVILNNFGSNIIVFGIMILEYEQAFSNITLDITGTGAGRGTLGFYDTNGNLLADIGPQIVSATGVTQFAIRQGKVALPPGRYLVGYTSDAAAWSLQTYHATILDYTYGTTTPSAGGQLPRQVTLTKGALHSLSGNFYDNQVPQCVLS